MRLAAAALLSLLFVSPCIAQNALTNGSFEDGLSGWYRNHDFSAAQHSELVERPDRGQCLKLTSDGSTIDYAQNLELEPGRIYVAQLDMKRSAPGNEIAAYLIVSRPNARDAYYRLGGGTTTVDRWQHLSRIVRIPANASRVRMLLLNRAEGATAWFDEVQVVPAAESAGPSDGWCPKLRVPGRADPLPGDPPQIDGTLAEGEWDDAAHISGFLTIREGAEPEANTEAWIAKTSTRLLMAIRCHEPLMSEADSVTEEPDSGRIFRDEVVEIFIDADNDHETYYHLAVNSIGTVYDASLGEGQVTGSDFNSGMTAAVAQEDNAWTVEVAIPFSALAVAGSDDIWGFNIGRERHIPEHSENTAWSATGSRFHAPWRFGDLVGLPNAASAVPVTARFEGPDELTPGASHLQFTLMSRADEERQIVLQAEVATPGGDVRQLQTTTALPAGGRQSVRIPIDLDARGQWFVSTTVIDAETQRPLYSHTTGTFIVPSVLHARLVRPSYRGRIFSKMGLQSIEVEAFVGVRAPERDDLRLVGRIAGADGTVETASADATAQRCTLEIPCADLPVGEYTVDVQLVRAGEVLGTVSDLPIEKLPPADEEVWFDRHNNLVVNGEPHFPIGFYSMDYPNLAEEVSDAGYLWYHTYASQRPDRLAPDSNWDWQAYLDAGAENDMRAFLGFGYRGDGEENFFERLMGGEAPEAHALMTGFIERWKDHPGLGAWYLYDEPVISGRTPEEMRYLYEMADSRDPYHPKLVCQVSWSDRRFVDFMDVLMPDPYPIKADMALPLTMVSDAVRSARRTVGDAKPVWAVLQWYGYEGGRFPTAEEMRCMAFLSLAAEAKGIVWYSFYHGYKRDRAGWPGLQEIGRELRSCEDVVLAPKAEMRIDIDDAPLEVLLKRGEDGRLHLIAVNPENRALDAVAVTLDAAAESATDRLTGQAVPVDGRTLTLDFEPYQPMVLDIEMAE